MLEDRAQMKSIASSDRIAMMLPQGSPELGRHESFLLHINNVCLQGDVLLKKSMYGALGTKSIEDILEGLQDKENRMSSLNPTPQRPSVDPHTPPLSHITRASN
ncbi:MAG: hypothetical protein K8R34_18775 [Methanosarcinales archaeon]|nr:hypothetical protein [Methanosarcinales archaeon]